MYGVIFIRSRKGGDGSLKLKLFSILLAIDIVLASQMAWALDLFSTLVLRNEYFQKNGKFLTYVKTMQYSAYDIQGRN